MGLRRRFRQRGPLHAAAGTLLITASVVFSRDATSAYALLYLFPCVYVYSSSHMMPILHMGFAAINYAIAIAIISSMSGAPMVRQGRVLHHLVITVGRR